MTTQSIEQQQASIIDDFNQFSDWTDRYEYLIDLGKHLEPLDEKYKSEAYLVKGCQSQVWLLGEIKDGRLFLKADSDAIITKGIIALLMRVFSGQKVEDIVKDYLKGKWAENNLFLINPNTKNTPQRKNKPTKIMNLSDNNIWH